MRNMSLLAIAFLTTGLVARAPQPAGQSSAMPLGTPGPNLPKGKAPEQGYVPEGWHPHAGSLLKYSVQIRFGEEPETMPEGMKFGRVSAVTTDAQNNVYVFKRDPKTDQLVVFDSQGTYLRSWGKGMFARPHGLRVDREGNVWAADDGGHQIFKFTREGKLLQTLGTKGVAGSDAKTFNRPTDLAWDSRGNLYVSDGYGNTRVVKFDKAGNYLTAWGTSGDRPGQFRVPHSIGVDSKDRVYVSDRENNRIQIFDAHGKLLKTLGPSRMHAEPLHHPEGRDVGADASQQHREHHLRHARRTVDEDRHREREDPRRAGIARSHDDRGTDRRYLRGQPDRQRFQVAARSRVAAPRPRGAGAIDASR